MSDKNPLAMSDEEFLNSTPPTVTEAPKEEPQPDPEPQPEPQKEEEPKPEETPDAPAEKPSEEPVTEPDAPADTDDKKVEPDQVPESKDGKSTDKKVEDTTEKADADKKVETPDYEKFYQTVMQPIKANGKTIEVKTPEEAIRLMQMGAGYTKKLQDLQPHLKTVRMLEKNDLLSEDKLSYLIDIHNKNPEAIKKLIKESGIDPLDLNPDDKVSYTPGNHSVSDAEMAFNDALTDVQSREGGQETISIINQTWDQKSVQYVWENPQLLGVIQSQREQGIYSLINAEIDRRKTLGEIPSNTPFLQAYKAVGDILTANGAFNHLVQKEEQRSPQSATPPGQEAQKPQPQVIATRTAQPKASVTNGDKAQAAAPTSSTRKVEKAPVNPLAMSDEDFMKQYKVA